MTDMKLNAISTAPREEKGWAREAHSILVDCIVLWIAIAYLVIRL